MKRSDRRKKCGVRRSRMTTKCALSRRAQVCANVVRGRRRSLLARVIFNKRHNAVTPFATIFNRGERRVMRTTAVRCARRRELRNCHVSGNFVPATALALGAVKTLLARVICQQVYTFPEIRGLYSISRFFQEVKENNREIFGTNLAKTFPVRQTRARRAKRARRPFSGGAPLHDRYTVSA